MIQREGLPHTCSNQCRWAFEKEWKFCPVCGNMFEESKKMFELKEEDKQQ